MRISDAAFREELLKTISQSAGQWPEIHALRPLGGGCINEAYEIVATTGRYFLKYNPQPLPHLFEREAEGLKALGQAGALVVPEPLMASGGWDGVPHYLLTTFIETGRQPADFHERFGRGLALMHQRAQRDAFGFHDDNYIGSTPQRNQWTGNWTEFWVRYRLGFQLDLAARNGHRGELQKLGQKLLNRLDEYLAEPDEPPCLLHGDLWSGNYMCTKDGEPAIIDPAVYYGRREADLAMTQLFGGFPPAFYQAYEEIWPLAPGSEARLDIYKLYHLLNHLNLFGNSYLGGCLGILRRYAG